MSDCAFWFPGCDSSIKINIMQPPKSICHTRAHPSTTHMAYFPAAYDIMTLKESLTNSNRPPNVITCRSIEKSHLSFCCLLVVNENGDGDIGSARQAARALNLHHHHPVKQTSPSAGKDTKKRREQRVSQPATHVAWAVVPCGCAFLRGRAAGGWTKA